MTDQVVEHVKTIARGLNWPLQDIAGAPEGLCLWSFWCYVNDPKMQRAPIDTTDPAAFASRAVSAFARRGFMLEIEAHTVGQATVILFRWDGDDRFGEWEIVGQCTYSPCIDGAADRAWLELLAKYIDEYGLPGE